MPALPAVTAYQEAVQSWTSFTEPELRACEVERHPRMLTPLVSSGGFALTYKLTNRYTGQKWAVRCFKTVIADRHERYAAISRFIELHQQAFFVPIVYSPKGLRINSDTFPITRMPWVEGETLSRYITNHYRDQHALLVLAVEFKLVVAELARLGIAHGDLSHLNIVVKNDGKIVLVDYDGMFVPALAGRQSAENGNASFQHPRRGPEHFDATLDRFSAIAIYLALQAIALDPSLYDNFDATDELLFSRTDFELPEQSASLKKISRQPQLKLLVERFRQVCRTSFVRIPTLSEYLADQQLSLPLSDVAIYAPAISRSAKTVFDATDVKTLRANIGSNVTVIGRIIAVYGRSNAGSSDDFLFLNFGTDRKNHFTLVFWADGLRLATQKRRKPGQYKNKWIKITGLLQQFNGNPQIVYDEHVNLAAISATEAKQLLGLPSGRLRPQASQAASSPVTPQTFASNVSVARPTSIKPNPPKPVTPPLPNTIQFSPGFSNPTSIPIRPPTVQPPPPALPPSVAPVSALPTSQPRPIPANSLAPSSAPPIQVPPFASQSSQPVTSLPKTGSLRTSPPVSPLQNPPPIAPVSPTSQPPRPTTSLPITGPPSTPSSFAVAQSQPATPPIQHKSANQPIGPVITLGQAPSPTLPVARVAVPNVGQPTLNPAAPSITVLPQSASKRTRKRFAWTATPIVSLLVLAAMCLALGCFVVVVPTLLSFNNFTNSGSATQTDLFQSTPPLVPTRIVKQVVTQLVVVPYGSNRTATATATHLNPTLTATPTPEQVETRTTKNVNLRAGPGTSYVVVAILYQDTGVIVDERTTDNFWYHVTVDKSGEQGWLHASTIAENPLLKSLPIAQTLQASATP